MNTKPIIDAVSLTISDLERSLDFYQNSLGFHLHNRKGATANLGSPDKPFLNLVEKPTAKRYRGTAGLYHFAVLLPSRRDLAQLLLWLIENRTPLQGLSDHGVSEAIYLPDPDGNGIEIYRDRPHGEWPFQDDQLQMVTEPLDIDDLLKNATAPSPNKFELPSGSFLGHIHLHVSEIAETENFYRAVLGFDLMQRYGGAAAFLSLHSYHHHVGVNTWNGVGIPAAPEDAIGLRWFSVRRGEKGFRERIRDSGVEFVDQVEGTYLDDPSGNRILILDAA